MTGKVKLDNISIVLHKPRYPENIGAAVRAMCNMGIEKLSVVDPENYNFANIKKLATHAALEKVEQINIYDNLKDALSAYTYIVGTTARTGGQRESFITPSTLASRLVLLTQQNNVAILFGPEDKGLTNEEIRYCHTLVNIPTADFSSVNLAQAVMILCYEIFIASVEKCNESIPRLASSYELNGMYDQLKDILVRISYLNPENPDYCIDRVRHFFNRINLRAKEVSIIRGVCRQINWYGNKCYKDGLEETNMQLSQTQR